MPAQVRAGQLDHGLRRLDLDYGLVDGDAVADGDSQQTIGLGQPFTDVGQPELARHLSLHHVVAARDDPLGAGQVVVLGAPQREDVSHPVTRATGA